jgi:dTDP-4-dehydrorhamnose 3,5-epimerase
MPKAQTQIFGTVPRLVAERAGVRLVIVPHPECGVGDVITASQSPRLIEGVEVEPLVLCPDDRGAFAEIFRFGRSAITRDFSSDRIQVSFTTSYPAVIKAIHYHFEQTDLWVPLKGMLQVFLMDLREQATTCGRINSLFVGELRPWKVKIPPGVAHGYKVIGTEAAHLLYATNRFYNPSDEGRISFDHPDINYDWHSRPR